MDSVTPTAADKAPQGLALAYTIAYACNSICEHLDVPNPIITVQAQPLHHRWRLWSWHTHHARSLSFHVSCCQARSNSQLWQPVSRPHDLHFYPTNGSTGQPVQHQRRCTYIAR